MNLSVSSGFRSYFRRLVLAFLFTIIATAGFAQCPITATCTPGNPPAANLIFGMGILNVNLNNGAINNTTPAVSATTGYVDYACTTGTTLTSTIPYPISIQTNNNGNENVRVWLDLDNNGAFNQTSELLFSSNNAKLHTGTFIIPASALTGVPLRLRIAADSYTSPVPTPCSTPQFSQTEDYRITVISNTMAPVAAFTASNTTTCTGTVSFTDNSQNGPISWLWNFDDPGSGTATISTLQNPTHTFSSPGTYDISLIVNNSIGTDTLIKTNYITYQAGITAAPACLPATISYCCGNGISNVNFGNGLMTNSSANGAAGYQDFTCTKSVTVTAGNKYPITLTGGTQPQDFRIYIDLNNDGSFTGVNEKVKEIFSAVNPSDSISIPGTTFINMPLRMRIISDELGSNFTSCGNIKSGQAEDYTIIIQPNPNKPITLFTSTYAAACDTIVNFYDKSLNGPTSWLWDFGDPASGAANSSTLKNPTHTFSAPGIYNISLSVSNANGPNMITKSNFINYDPTYPTCHQIPMPASGSVTVTNCTGTIYDDGGLTNNYANNTNGTIVIAPTGASSVSLTFTQFNVETGADVLRIYDGTSASAPLIGTYTGTGIPNSGTPIISSGGALTVVFNTSATINDAGFSADWLCSYPVGVVESTSVPVFEIYPNPSEGNVNLKLRNKRSDQFRLEVMNVLGQVQVQKVVNLFQSDAYSLDLSSLAKGVYFIRLQNDKISEIRKIVLE